MGAGASGDDKDLQSIHDIADVEEELSKFVIDGESSASIRSFIRNN